MKINPIKLTNLGKKPSLEGTEIIVKKTKLYKELKMNKNAVAEALNITDDLFNMFSETTKELISKSKLFGIFGKKHQKMAEEGLIKFDFLKDDGNILLEITKKNSQKTDYFIKNEEKGILKGINVLRKNKEGTPVFSINFNYFSNDKFPHKVVKYTSDGLIKDEFNFGFLKNV